MKNKLLGLTESQKEFVLGEDKFNLLIACGGSGKTLSVARKVGYMISQRYPANKIYTISFTRAAARELKRRIAKVDKLGKDIQAFTFHSFVLNFMKEYESKEFNMISDSEKEILLKSICKRFDIDNYKQVLDQLKISIKTGNKKIQYAINEYIFRLNMFNLMDVDLMLPLFLDKITNDSDFLEWIREQIECLFYDEAQDMNKIQYDILTKIIPPTSDKGLTLIGDEDQNIYEWNNTDIKYILGFEESYNASRYILDTNFRCSNQIIQEANNLISKNEKRFDKDIKGTFDAGEVVVQDFNNETEELFRIVGMVSNYINTDETIAILCRSNKDVLKVSNFIKEYGIEVNSSIKVEYEKSEIDMLKLILNPANNILVETLFKIDSDLRIKSLDENLPLIDILIESSNLKVQQKAKVIKSLNLAIKRVTAKKAITLIENALDTYFDENIIAALDLWSESLKSTDINNINNFLDFLTSRDSQDALKVGKSSIFISTIHGVKGLEYNEVILFNFNNHNYKKKGNIEETRRLLYVAYTRAINKLNLFYAKKSLDFVGKEIDSEISELFREDYSN